jgi:hypothetical protein
MIKSRGVKYKEHVTRIFENWNAYRIFVGKPEGNRPLGRHRRGWEDKTKIYIRERDRLCCIVVRVRGYRSRSPGSIPGAIIWNRIHLAS